ncbi:MAG: flagellar protein FlaG [Gammaproteobacteria bacterium]|nr:flagellar protein FlaG [Gammaproteobacteria bacterium]
MEILSTQIGQNFAGNIPKEQPKTEVVADQVALDSSSQNAQKNGVPEAEDVQAEQKSADNYNREEQAPELDGAVREIQSFLQTQNRNLAFSVDEGTNRSVVTVKDSTSGDVIRQIPSDEVLRLAERIKDLQQDIGSSVGVLFNKQV